MVMLRCKTNNRFNKWMRGNISSSNKRRATVIRTKSKSKFKNNSRYMRKMYRQIRLKELNKRLLK